MPVGVGGGKERGGCHLNLRTWHAEGRRLILGLCWPILGLCWSILRLCWPMLAHLEGYVGPSWGYVGPSWGYIGPSWGLCWPILGAMLAHLEAMLAHLEAYVGPCWLICRPKPWVPTPNPEKRENPSRLKDFRGGSAAGARPRVAKAMLSFHHKQRGIAGYTFKGCRPCRRPRACISVNTSSSRIQWT